MTKTTLTNSEYMTSLHPDAFLDFPVPKPVPKDNYRTCPVCNGRGGWNLRLNAYPLPPHVEDTPENRHKYVHFRASCYHCNGWGYVHQSVTCDGHNWVYVKNLGKCYNQYKCSKCGAINNVDSSD